MQSAHDRQKSYADKKRKLMDFQAGDKVLEKVGAVAYKLELPQELSRVHNTFHVSNLKRCYSDDPLTVSLDGLHVDDKLHFVEEPVQIMDREVKQLRHSRVPILKDCGLSTRDYLELDDPYVQVALQAPPSPDYIHGPKEPQSPPLPDFVPEPVYPEYMPQEDEVFSAEEQPLPAAASPTAQSPDYVPELRIQEVDIEADDEEEEKHPAPADSTVVALPAADQAPSAKET
ncbi:hypothetical protein Tco_1036222 [Tanacetum coccineum]